MGPDSASVFISHTSRQRSVEELSPGDTMGRHKARKHYVRQLTSALTTTLGDKHIGVWLDEREIAGGDEFEQAICLALIRCSAAVILIDRDALTSGFMQEEARLLGWRKILEHKLQILPVLLGDVTETEFAESPLGRAGGLSRLSTFSPSNKKRRNQLAAQQAAAEISARIDLLPLDPKAARWVNAVAHFIAPAPLYALAEAAETLGIDEQSWRYHHEKSALVAAALLNSNLQNAYLVMRTLAEYLSQNSRKGTVRRVIPLWVDLENARVLMSVADVPAQHRIVTMITQRLVQAEHAVLRASASAPNVETTRLSTIGGEDMAAELIARYDNELRAALNLESDDAPEDIDRYLRQCDTVIFALMKCDGVPQRVVQDVVRTMMRRFPGVIFALVSAHRGRRSRAVRARQVVLAGDEKEDRMTWHLIKQVSRLTDEPLGALDGD